MVVEAQCRPGTKMVGRSYRPVPQKETWAGISKRAKEHSSSFFGSLTLRLFFWIPVKPSS